MLLVYAARRQQFHTIYESSWLVIYRYVNSTVWEYGWKYIPFALIMSFRIFCVLIFSDFIWPTRFLNLQSNSCHTVLESVHLHWCILRNDEKAYPIRQTISYSSWGVLEINWKEKRNMYILYILLALRMWDLAIVPEQ